MLLAQKTSGAVPPASAVFSLVSYSSFGVCSQLTLISGFLLWNRSSPFWTFSFSRMLPQPIMEIVTWALPPCAGAAVAGAAPAAPPGVGLAGAAGVPPQAASRLRPAAPKPSWPARRRNSRRVRRLGVGCVESLSLDICVLSFEVSRLHDGLEVDGRVGCVFG